MDIQQMIYFKTIVEQGTISKAARFLHMAQPPLSMQLKKLEEELQVELIKRGSRQIEMTESGAIFYKRCLQIIELTEISKNELMNKNTYTLRIGITSSNHQFVFNKSLVDLLKQDNIHISIKEGSTYSLLELLLSHNIDLGIVRTPFDSSLVDAYYLQKEPMIIVGSDQYHYLKEVNEPVIIHQRYLQFIEDYCTKHHIHLNIKVICDDSRTSFAWAKMGIGLAIVPYGYLLNDEKLKYSILKDKQLYTGIALITRKNENLTPYINQVIEACKKEDYLHT